MGIRRGLAPRETVGPEPERRSQQGPEYRARQLWTPQSPSGPQPLSHRCDPCLFTEH